MENINHFLIKKIEAIKNYFADFKTNIIFNFKDLILWLLILFFTGIIISYTYFPKVKINDLQNIYIIIFAIISTYIFILILNYFIQKLYEKNRLHTAFYDNFIDLTKIILISSLFLFSGFLRMHYRTYKSEISMLSNTIKDTEITGEITDIEHFPNNKYRLTLKDVNCEKCNLNKIGKIQLTTNPKLEYLPNKILIGYKIKLKADITGFNSSAYISGFDYKRYSYYKGISAKGEIKKIISYESVNNKNLLEKINIKIKRYRQNITENIKSILKKGDAMEVALTLITGERNAANKKIQKAYQETGTAHILAISGFHMSVIAGLIFITLRFAMVLITPISRKYDISIYASIGTIIFTTIYLLLSGARISTQRSYIMLVSAIFAIMIGRSPISIRLLLLSAFIILIISPEAIFNAGFQLSFIAVIGLISIYQIPKVKSFFIKQKQKSNILTFIYATLITDLISTLITGIFAVYHFNKFPIYSMATNFFTTPIFIFAVMPLIALYLFTYPLDINILNSSILWLIDISITAMNKIVYFFSELPNTTVFINYISPLSLIIFTLGLLWFAIWNNKYKYLGIISIPISLIITILSKQPDLIVNNNGNIFFKKNKNRIYFMNIKGKEAYKLSKNDRFSISKRYRIYTKNVRYIKNKSYYKNDKMIINFHQINKDEICLKIRLKKSNKEEYHCTNKENEISEFYITDDKIKIKTKYQ